MDHDEAHGDLHGPAVSEDEDGPPDASSRAVHRPQSSSMTSQLCLSCLAVMRLVLKRLSSPTEFSKSSTASFRDSCSAFILWVDSYDIALGGIDAAIATSRPLKRLMFKMLTAIASCLTYDLLPLLDLRPIPWLRGPLHNKASRLNSLVSTANDSLHTEVHDDDDSDSDSDLSFIPRAPTGKTFEEVTKDFKTHVQCLADLGPLIQSPGETRLRPPTQPKVMGEMSKTMSSRILYRISGHILWRHPRLDGGAIIDRLARANLDRFNRVRGVADQGPAWKGKGKAIAGVSADKPSFDPESVRVSFYGEDKGPDGIIPMPKLPEQAAVGLPFPCVACGQLVFAMTRAAWKKHVYHDLRPWMCLEPGCLQGDTPFATKKAWTDHLTISHQLGEKWAQSPCELCGESNWRDLGDLIRHLAAHLEQISLTALPAGIVPGEPAVEDEDDHQPAMIALRGSVAESQPMLGIEPHGEQSSRLPPKWPSTHLLAKSTGEDPVKGKGVEESNIGPMVVRRVRCPADVPGHQHHRQNTLFRDQPRLFRHDTMTSQLRGKEQLPQNIDYYLNDHPHISFVVIREYDCVAYHNLNMLELSEAPRGLELDAAFAKPVAESIRTTAALDRVVEKYEKRFRIRRGHRRWKDFLHPPYLHYFTEWGTAILDFLDPNHFEPDEIAHVASFVAYMERTVGADHREAKDQFSKGVVSRKHFNKLFPSGHSIFSKEENKPPVALMVTSPPAVLEGEEMRIHCYTWEFDGSLYQSHRTLTVRWPGSVEGTIPITQLSAFPIEFDADLVGILRERGNSFWQCRRGGLFELNEPGTADDSPKTINPENRYMVDPATYHALHGTDDKDGTVRRGRVLEEEKMKDLIPPDSDDDAGDSFALLLPPEVHAFGLHDKKWTKLPVESLRPPRWNTSAYQNLILDDRKKEAISAITHAHHSKKKPALILLHGPPGTGKTLSAETFTETLKVPLYRITCADLGTDPIDVERHMKDAMHLCQIWNAVLLLDGCDMYLEQPKQADIQHNALVSVMLHALEKYRGIVFMTSSRVKIMEERFASRIQLPVLYPLLDSQARRQIWQNHFRDLQHQQQPPKTSEGLRSRQSSSDDDPPDDIEDLLHAVDELGEENLNGWQIQHAVTTARQLASWRGESLDTTHMREAILLRFESESQDGPEDLRKSRKTGDPRMCVQCNVIFLEEENQFGVCRYHTGVMQLFDETKISADIDDVDSEATRAAFPDAFRWLCCDVPGSRPGCRRGRHHENPELSRARRELASQAAIPFNDLLATTHDRPIRSDSFKDIVEGSAAVKLEAQEKRARALKATSYTSNRGEKRV